MSTEPVVVVDGKRYVPEPVVPGLMDEPDMPGHETWIPSVGQDAWITIDSGPPIGRCIGYLNHPGTPRHGQPVFEKDGKQFCCHPYFLWPFEPGSPEHEQAKAEGRFR